MDVLWWANNIGDYAREQEALLLLMGTFLDGDQCLSSAMI